MDRNEKTVYRLQLQGLINPGKKQNDHREPDFKGFTEHAEKLTPEELVESVDFYFSKFDDIMEKYDLEKIKTVGDAYMCAGGLPFPTK